MTEENFDEVLSLIREKIIKQDTAMRSAIAPELKLTLTTRYFASGSTFTDLQYQFRIHESAKSKFIPDMSRICTRH